jgi:hypothetical protein
LWEAGDKFYDTRGIIKNREYVFNLLAKWIGVVELKTGDVLVHDFG